MKENGDEKRDELARKIIKKASLASPSSDFTSLIVAQVIALKENEHIVFRPLISKKTWFIILGCILALGLYATFGLQTEGQKNVELLNFNTFLNHTISKIFSRLAISKIVVYALFSLATMVLIQVFVFKRYLEKN